MSPESPRRFVHHGAFGNDRFGVLAERFARFFGTPRFIIGQTALVAVWILLNARTREAERDKLRDAATREDHENTKLTEEIARLTEELRATICLPPNMAPSTGA